MHYQGWDGMERTHKYYFSHVEKSSGINQPKMNVSDEYIASQIQL